MNNFDYNHSDWLLLAKVESGDRIDFKNSGLPVHAGVLRSLMLGLHLPPVPAYFATACDNGQWRTANLPALPATSTWRNYLVPGTGIWITGARIEGMLDLENGMLADNKPMPNLRLHECDILGDIGKCDTSRGGIKLKSAHLRTLSLKGSHIIELDADYARFEGLLDISGISGFADVRGARDGHLCRVSLRGAQLDAGVEAAGARLVSHPKDDDYVKYSRQSVYALDLPEVNCTGDIRLFPDFCAIGGVNINGADIRGSFKAHGAKFVAIQLHALDAAGTNVTGSIDLDSRNVGPKEGKKQPSHIFKCEGNLRLRSARIGENLHLYGAYINGSINALNVNVSGNLAMAAFSGSEIVGGNIVSALLPFTSLGTVSIRGAHIGGDLDFRGAILKSVIGQKCHLDATVVHAGGCARFDSAIYWDKLRSESNPSIRKFFESHIEIKLENTRIEGYLTFEGATLRAALEARGLRVDGYGFFNTCKVGARYQQFTSSGNINLHSASFGLTLDFSGAILRNGMTAPEIKIGTKLLLCAYVDEDSSQPDLGFQWLEAHKRINLSGATMESDFDLTGAKLHCGLRFRGGHVKSALIIDVYNADASDGQRHTLDLFNAHANLVSDHCANETTFGYADFDLRLEGFTYGRFLLTGDTYSLTAEELERRNRLRKGLKNRMGFPDAPDISDSQWLKMRLEWLALQFPRNSEGKRKPTRRYYNASAHNNLYKFFKTNGYVELATTVLYRKLKIDLELSAGRTESLFWMHRRSADDEPIPQLDFVSWLRRLINIPFNVDTRYGPDLLLVLFRFFSGFGLNVTRTISWNILFMAIITGMVYLASYDYTHRMILDAWAGDRIPVKAATTPRQCDSAAKVFFAISIYTPGVDLAEAKSCAEITEQNNFWRIVFSLWQLVGVIFVPLTALTVTGFFRRQAEP